MARGGDYAGLAGIDGSRGFVTGEFDFAGIDEGSDISGIPLDDVKIILHWRNFYRTHPAYHFVAVLAGRFYNLSGLPLPTLLEAEKVYGRWKRVDEVYQECTNEDHGWGTTPVHFWWLVRSPDPADKPQEDERCACVSPAQRAAVERAGAYNEPDGVTATIKFTDYPGCRPDEPVCKPTGAVVVD